MKEVAFVGDALGKADRAIKAAELALTTEDGFSLGVGKEVQKATQVSLSSTKIPSLKYPHTKSSQLLK